MTNIKKILVTGGAGFIGSHLVDRLIREDYEVVIIDNLSTGRKEYLNPKAKFYKADVCSLAIDKVFGKEKIDVVFHYAAQINVQKSTKEPAGDAKINILGAINVLENCRKFKIKKIVFASSAGVYGESKFLPIKENHPLNPISPYPVTKLTVEKYLSYYQSLGLNFVVLRYSNVYGPRQTKFTEGGVVEIFINKILNKRIPVIYGDGKQTRDFLYVADAVEAAVKSLNAPSGSIYNIGTNKEISINQLYKLISEITNASIRPKKAKARFGDIKKNYLDFSKFKKELNWKPKYNLEEGLKETVDWFKDNLYGK